MSLLHYNVPAYMRKLPVITDFGRIADPDGFSQRISGRGPLHETIPLKPVNGKLCLDDVPANFHAAIRMAEAIHNADTPDQPNCALQVFQGTLQPGRNFGVIEPHIDSIINSYPDNNGVLEDSFIISDALPTIFYRQAFDLPDYAFAKREDFYWRLSEIFKTQVQPENRFIPEPYHLVRFNALTVHESQLAAVPTDRTVAVMHFF